MALETALSGPSTSQHGSLQASASAPVNWEQDRALDFDL